MASTIIPEKNLTIVIPTYNNRSHFLETTLRYFNQVGCPFRIVIADSSPQNVARVNQQLIESLRGSNFIVDYQHFPEDVAFYLKVADTLADLKTPYVCVCGDDDFLVPDALAEGVRFLDKHLDYSAVTGHAALLKMVRYPQHPLFCTCTYPQMAIEAATPQQRLINHYSNYTPTFYSVYRQHTMLRIFQQLKMANVNYIMGELLQTAIGVIHGKIGKLNRLMLVRRVHPTSAGHNLKLATVLQSEEFESQYRVFRERLADELQLQDSSIGDPKPLITDAFKARLALAARRGSVIQCQLDEETIYIPARSFTSIQVEKIVLSVQAMVKNILLVRSMASLHHIVRCAGFEDNTMSVLQMLRRDSIFYRDFAPLYTFLMNTY